MKTENFVEELRWRGLIHDITPSTEDFLLNNPTSGYIGFDPTADSLHIGNLVHGKTIILISSRDSLPDTKSVM